MRNLFVTIVLIIGTSLYFPSAQAENLRFFRVGTGGIAGTYYPIGGMIAHAISNPPGDRPCDEGGSCGPPGLLVIAQSANGSVANVNNIQLGSLESGFVQSNIAYWAYTGTGIFEDLSPTRELRAIASLYPESIHIVARKDSDIATIADLAGKRVSLDEPGSGTLIDAALVLDAFGISREEMEVEYLKPDLAIRRIKENKLDAFFIVAGYPAKAVTVLAEDSGLRLLPVNGPAADDLISRHSYYSRDHIPADVYPGVGRTETLSVGAQWLVGASVDSKLVYEITRSLWHQNSRQLLDNGHRKGRNITLDTALEGITIPLHPGASRFYREIGLTAD